MYNVHNLYIYIYIHNYYINNYNELDEFDDVNERCRLWEQDRYRVPWLHHPRSEQVALLVRVSLPLPFFRSTLDIYWSFPGQDHSKVSVSIPGGIPRIRWYQNGSEWYYAVSLHNSFLRSLQIDLISVELCLHLETLLSDLQECTFLPGFLLLPQMLPWQERALQNANAYQSYEAGLSGRMPKNKWVELVEMSCQ